MTETIFDKTDKGREEIATRKHQLPSRLRSLLVMVDGKQSEGELLQKLAGIGMTDQSFADLLTMGFIAVASPATPAVEDLAGATTAASLPPPQDGDPAPFMPDEQSQFEAIYRLYTETIKSTIGLRGYALQLKVEKAASVDDFRALRQPYLDAVLKAKGNEVARGMRDRLDALLYPEEEAPQTTFVDLSAGVSE